MGGAAAGKNGADVDGPNRAVKERKSDAAAGRGGLARAFES